MSGQPETEVVLKPYSPLAMMAAGGRGSDAPRRTAASDTGWKKSLLSGGVADGTTVVVSPRPSARPGGGGAIEIPVVQQSQISKKPLLVAEFESESEKTAEIDSRLGESERISTEIAIVWAKDAIHFKESRVLAYCCNFIEFCSRFSG
jgi:hypothetical protein